MVPPSVHAHTGRPCHFLPSERTEEPAVPPSDAAEAATYVTVFPLPPNTFQRSTARGVAVTPAREGVRAARCALVAT